MAEFLNHNQNVECSIHSIAIKFNYLGNIIGFVTSWEDDLIHPKHWKELYNEMPIECQRLIDDHEEGIGIGKNEEFGWFTAFCGQGPVMDWSEKESK